MTKKMLIDATHSEETRVAVVEDGRLDEFDYESAFRKPLKGNIYLAKVTRVEPSLQAAFVNFGGNRHGFLPFSEIHPDYFRIPIADREALIAEQEAEMREHDELEEEEDVPGAEEAEGVEEEHEPEESVIEEIGGDISLEEEPAEKAEDKKIEAAAEPEFDEEGDEISGNLKEEPDDPEGNVAGAAGEEDEHGQNHRGGRYQRGRGGRNRRGGRDRGDRGGRGGSAAHKARRVETFGGDDASEEQRFRFSLRRKYKIQEVIKRGQIMLVQVSKEERGNKGAAVGSYLSLPGRYCVLMPNSPRAGGVSRKIASYKERARMREIMKDLEVPKGMSVILRTAGVSRTKAEIKRDLDYLMKLWDTIRSLTLESSAPALVYEEADLIKRAVRDLYTRDVEEIHVAGEEGFKTARNFMKMMIPSHVKRVFEYNDKDGSLFSHYKIEGQIAEIGETQVTLPAGGYLVINPTEALVSIDVNSGKSTKERHIEETALRTNLEAAAEVARQLRLRDLGGLIVIDFIDMEDRRNNAKVERKMREALSTDRARIQMGRISSFGLMELSRQRLSPSLTESQFEICSHCHGTGRVRTADAASIMVLRAIEAEGIKDRAAQVIVHVSNAVALYILNYKRNHMAEIEQRYGFKVLIRVDDDMGAAGFRVEVSKPLDKSDGDEADEVAEDRDDRPQQSDQDNKGGDRGDRNERGGRRRGRRGGRGRGGRNRDGSERSDNNAESAKGDHSEEQFSQAGDEKPAQEKIEDVQSDNASKAKKPAKKAAKKSEKETDDRAEKKSKPAKKVKASNDDAPEDTAPKDYERVNEPPSEKKKGWWNKLTD